MNYVSHGLSPGDVLTGLPVYTGRLLLGKLNYKIWNDLDLEHDDVSQPNGLEAKREMMVPLQNHSKALSLHWASTYRWNTSSLVCCHCATKC